MKIKRSNSVFEAPRRRRRLPIIRIVLVLAFIAFLLLVWQRGGEQPQTPVEKPIPAEKLGQ